MKRLTIDPVTRLEGHGKIEIFLNEEDEVAGAYFQVPELRGFESFCVGRMAEEMPVLTSRVCGVCPEAHHLASVKALDDLFDVDPPPAAKKIRELLYMAFFVADHTTHFFVLGGPDLLVGPDAPPAERNFFGVLEKLGLEAGQQVIACRARNHEVIKTLGGRGVHPTAGLPGGWSKTIAEEERRGVEQAARQNVAFALQALKIFQQKVLEDPLCLEMLTSEAYLHRTYYMGTVDAGNRLNFYHGSLRVVDPEGREVLRCDPRQYAMHIAEHVEPWTYVKFPYLKKIGWKGFVDGPESGVYCATPLSRLNVSDALSTPLAEEFREKFFVTLGSRKVDGRYQPVHYRMATHWARLIELLYASERMLELAQDPEITSPRVRELPTRVKGVGIGALEAPRGTLFHHYTADEKGVLTGVNIIAGTTNNYAAISMSIKKAAEKLIKKGQIVEEGLLNRIEMAFRLYDPCFACASHALPGRASLIISLRDYQGEVLRTWRRE